MLIETINELEINEGENIYNVEEIRAYNGILCVIVDKKLKVVPKECTDIFEELYISKIAFPRKLIIYKKDNKYSVIN